MSIARVSDTIVKDLPRLLLEASKFNSKDSSLDAADFKADRDFRSYVDKYLPVMIIIDYGDIEKELDGYNLSQSSIDKIMRAFKAAMTKSSGLVQSISYTELSAKMAAIATNNQLSTIEKTLHIRKLFTKGYVFSDSESIKQNQLVFVVHNFAAVSTRINKFVNDELKKEGVESPIGAYLDAGHSSIKFGDSYAFNSPKQTAMLFDISTTSADSFLSKSINLNTATDIFVKRTEQLEQSVEVTKDFGSTFASIFVEFGGSIVVYENAVNNQQRGQLEKQEKFGTNQNVLKKMVKHFQHIKDTAIKGQYNTSELSKIIRNLYKYASSPSAIDMLVHNIASTIIGKPKEVFKQTKKVSKKSTTTTSRKVSVPKLKAIQASVKQGAKPIELLNLTNLQNLLNQRLHDQIKANMGTGQSRSTLNYRSGRLAQSAQVERMSESRAGMITAFYTYMKYPYATFSDGGAQQSPKSRDPKLLIAKSIREIAGTSVANRMRAVNV